MRILILAAVLTPTVIISSASQSASQRPTDQQVLTFIGDTIDWYRQLPTSQRIGSEPADLFFLENNRSTALEIVRLSFRFGKAVAALDPPQSMPRQQEAEPGSPADRELAYLLSVKGKLGGSAQRSTEQLESLSQARLTARAADRKKLDTQIAEMRARIELLNTISANYQNLADFVREASTDPDRHANLAALIEDLERTVPELPAAGTVPAAPSIPADPPREPYGIMGRISRVSAVSRKQHYVETAIGGTNVLLGSLQKLRTPFREAFLRQLANFSSDEQNLNALQQQKALLEGMVAQLHTVSPAVTALIREETLLNLYRSHLAEWHLGVQMECRAAWRALIVRFCALAAAIAVLFGIDVVARRILSRHARDYETRQALLVGQRVLFWVVLIAIVLVAFAFDPTALATFFGLVTAGLAVGLRDVLLAIGGRMLLARRFHVRVGERIEIAGVKGDVTELGLMEFALNETDAAGQATGREVHFANSYVFVSPATPLFRQIGEPA